MVDDDDIFGMGSGVGGPALTLSGKNSKVHEKKNSETPTSILDRTRYFFEFFLRG
jgi:hypothetical protein